MSGFFASSAPQYHEVCSSDRFGEFCFVKTSEPCDSAGRDQSGAKIKGLEMGSKNAEATQIATFIVKLQLM